MKTNVEVIDATDCVLIKQHELSRLIKLITSLEERCDQLQTRNDLYTKLLESLPGNILGLVHSPEHAHTRSFVTELEAENTRLKQMVTEAEFCGHEPVSNA